MANLKSIKKGDKVILRMFTGAYVDTKVVEMADAKKLGFTNKAGVKMVFDKATGKQISPEPKNERYANLVEIWSEEAEAEGEAKKKTPKGKKPSKTEKAAPVKTKPSKKKAPEPEEDEDEEYEPMDDDEEYDEAEADEDEDDEEDDE